MGRRVLIAGEPLAQGFILHIKQDNDLTCSGRTAAVHRETKVFRC